MCDGTIQRMGDSAAEVVGRIAAHMLAGADELGEEMDAAILEAAPALAADASIAAETRASTHANLQRWVTAMVRRPGEPVSADVPPEALDVARSVVRRGIDLEELMTAYRVGQNVAWRRWMEAAAEEKLDGRLLIEVLDVGSSLMFNYVDAVLDGVLAEAARVREELLGGALARRTETVRLILDGAPLAEQRASRQLGYELDRGQTALVVWVESAGQAHGALERAATALAQAAGAHRPLTLPAGTTALWAWLGTDDAPPDPAALRAALQDAEPHVRATVGPTRHGMTGFRRSHAAAIATQRLVAGNPTGDRLTTYEEVEVVALAGQDAEQTAEFVASVLGPLAKQGDPAVERLRETLRVYLDEGGNGPRAARRLNTHRNTVLARVARAEDLLGHGVGERRLALALALELAARLGASALARA
jgi:DNA-binding PucR family transcriptional regulator